MLRQAREGWTKVLGLVVMVMVVVSCAQDRATRTHPGSGTRVDTPIQQIENLPQWITQKGAAFNGERRVFYGVGNAAAIRNPALRRRSAEAAARRDLQQTFQVYVAGLNKQYMAETTAGDMNSVSVEQHIEDVMKQVTRGTLVGAGIVEYWENPTRNEVYALARLDLERFVDVMQNYSSTAGTNKELDATVKAFVRKNAAKAHDDLNRELGIPGDSAKGLKAMQQDFAKARSKSQEEPCMDEKCVEHFSDCVDQCSPTGSNIQTCVEACCCQHGGTKCPDAADCCPR